jgi:anion-transporting  ArsA/GET3 family ATPase
MSDRPRGVRDLLLAEGARLLSRTAGAVLSDPRGQQILATAVGAAQRGKERLEKVQDRLLHALGLPVKEDYDDLVKRLVRLKRRVRELSEQLEEEEGAASKRRR